MENVRKECKREMEKMRDGEMNEKKEKRRKGGGRKGGERDRDSRERVGEMDDWK